MKIKNPILSGFHPDPSIIRVNDDYYLANSTFEWFPGVIISHSKDLKNWRLLNYALTRKEQLDMIGNPDSCGVWAPSLSYCDGVFYLVFSNVRSFDGGWKDTPNFLVTTTNIEKGEWSNPIFLNSCGFDASLFHDDDGRKWYSSLLVDHRKDKFFGGIVLQEFDVKTNKLVGPMKNIFAGTELGITEGPNFYKHNGYYYLLTAEGGTEYNHAVSMARSSNIWGPYEVHPQNPIISSRYNPDAHLQKAGHGSLVETVNGEWFCAFLTSRPLSKLGRCTLGRETSIARMVWSNDHWLYQVTGHCEPQCEVEWVEVEEVKLEEVSSFDHFDSSVLNPHFNSLRIPVSDDWCSLTERKGYLRLFGRESLNSFHRQSLIARRVECFDFEASTVMEFEPENFQQMAGLVCYYNTIHYHYLHVSHFQEIGKTVLQILTCNKGDNSEPLQAPIDISGVQRIGLKAKVNGAKLQFYYSTDEMNWMEAGQVLDFSILSDDYVCDAAVRYRPAFTGAFIGICTQDLSGYGCFADFDFFNIQKLTNNL